MDYNNDERYWNINLLNKWFLLASILWTISMIWMFIDDNDDEFKNYQREFYKISKEKTEEKYSSLYAEVIDIKITLEADLENKKQIFVPRGFAHGFLVLSKGAIFSYKVDAYYSAEHNEGIAYNDKDIAIDWHLSEVDIKLSIQDQKNPNLADKKKLL